MAPSIHTQSRWPNRVITELTDGTRRTTKTTAAAIRIDWAAQSARLRHGDDRRGGEVPGSVLEGGGGDAAARADSSGPLAVAPLLSPRRRAANQPVIWPEPIQ
jgi:hypothetical protein